MASGIITFAVIKIDWLPNRKLMPTEFANKATASNNLPSFGTRLPIGYEVVTAVFGTIQSQGLYIVHGCALLVQGAAPCTYM